MKYFRSWLVGLVVAVVLMSGVGTRDVEATALINSDFSNSFTGWSGKIKSGDAGFITDVSDFSVSSNFSASNGEAILTNDDTYYGVNLSQIFTVDSFSTLSFDYLWETTYETSFSDNFVPDSSGFYDYMQISLQYKQADGNFSAVQRNLGGDFVSMPALLAGGTVSWDLDEFIGKDLLLAFHLEDGDYAYPDSLKINNLKITEREVNPVPEPSTFILIGVGFAGLAFKRARRM